MDPPEALLGLAQAQGSNVTREQVLRLGVSRRSVQRLLEQGHWQSRGSGIYTLTPEREDFESTAWAGVLAGGDEAMLGEHAAGRQWGLCPTNPPEVVVLVPQSSNRSSPRGVRFVRRRQLPAARGKLPCSPVNETVLDLCAAEPGRTVEWITTALRQRLTTSAQLRAALDRRQRLSGRVRHRILVLLRDADGLESPLEELFARRVLGAHGLPRGERQWRHRGKRHDVRIGRVLVELDGRLGHGSVRDSFRDMGRDNESATDGLVTLRYGYHDCWERPCETAQQIATVLAIHGMPVQPHPCPACQRP